MEQISYDIEKEISRLNSRFLSSTKSMGKNNVQGTELHVHQTDFAYKLNKLKYAPDYVLGRMISNIHTFINEIPK